MSTRAQLEEKITFFEELIAVIETAIESCSRELGSKIKAIETIQNVIETKEIKIDMLSDEIENLEVELDTLLENEPKEG